MKHAFGVWEEGAGEVVRWRFGLAMSQATSCMKNENEDDGFNGAKL